MFSPLYLKTISPLLYKVLISLMQAEVFSTFRLVGGTALSLQCGHRTSEDIDLFTDAPYRTIDFHVLEVFLRNNWQYVDTNAIVPIGIGKPFFVGDAANQCVKLDLFYTDDFLDGALIREGIRMASLNDLVAMKIDVILRGGRKKDFWDLHELMNSFSLQHMLELHAMRYPYTHDSTGIKVALTDFNKADLEFDPVCLRGKHWEIIKLDLLDFVSGKI